MCHSDVAPGQAAPLVERTDVGVPLGGEQEMPATLITAGGGGPPVLLISDMFGPSPFYEHLAARLADAGLDVLLPDYFFRQGPIAARDPKLAIPRRAKMDEGQSLQDLGQAVDWLKRQAGTERVGVVGFCMGGTFALDLASQRDDLVTVTYYGFPIPQPTIPKPPPRPLDLVDRLRGPVLAFWGTQDRFVEIESVQLYVERAAAANPDFAHALLPGLGHGFLADVHFDDDGDPGAITWARALAHLREHLG